MIKDGVAATGMLLKIIGLFCKRDLHKTRYSATETYIFKEPTNGSHPMWASHIWWKMSYNCWHVWIGTKDGLGTTLLQLEYDWMKMLLLFHNCKFDQIKTAHISRLICVTGFHPIKFSFIKYSNTEERGIIIAVREVWASEKVCSPCSVSYMY